MDLRHSSRPIVKLAKQNGLTRYFTGKPCKKGHVSERRVATNSCIECERIHNKNFWEKNSERKIKNASDWYLKNREISCLRARTWHSINREKSIERKRKWRISNLAYDCAKVSERKANKLKATPKWADKNLIEDIYMEANYFGLEVDHIIPLKNPIVCGLHVEHNLQLLTSEENLKKHNKFTP